MEKYKLNSKEELNDEVLLSLIKRFIEKEIPRLKKLERYYLNENDILNRVMSDTNKPNNKVSHPLAGYIVDTIQGYFLGKPVKYSSNNEELMVVIQEIFDKNKEQNLNSSLGKDVGIFGVGYELIYRNEAGDIKLNKLNTKETFMIYDNSIEENELFAVNFMEITDYITEENYFIVNVYDEVERKEFKLIDNELILKDITIHNINKIPVNKYINNEKEKGDFEDVITLIDGYDKAVSDTANDLDYFSDSYMIMKGFDPSSLDEGLFEKLKENKIIAVNEGGDVGFLNKNGNSTQVEEFKNRLRDDIHSLSHTPNINDESFGNAASGESLKYKLFDLETMVSIKERYFKDGLEKRIGKITSTLNIKNSLMNNKTLLNETDIVMNFVRNLPGASYTIADIKSLYGVVSSKTLLSLLPFVEDPGYELELLKEEMEGSVYENLQENVEYNKMNEETIDEIL